MNDVVLAEIRLVAFNYAPRGWALCNGQLLSIAQNQALFSLLGTTFGGNGVTNFALPDLRGRGPMHWGNGPGLSPVNLGQVGGTTSTTLLATQIPSHVHMAAIHNTTGEVMGSAFDGDSTNPDGNYFAIAANTPDKMYGAAANGKMSFNGEFQADAQVTLSGGGSQPHSNMMPYLGMTFIIALQGIYPSRN